MGAVTLVRVRAGTGGSAPRPSSCGPRRSDRGGSVRCSQHGAVGHRTAVGDDIACLRVRRHQHTQPSVVDATAEPAPSETQSESSSDVASDDDHRDAARSREHDVRDRPEEDPAPPARDNAAVFAQPGHPPGPLPPTGLKQTRPVFYHSHVEVQQRVQLNEARTVVIRTTKPPGEIRVSRAAGGDAAERHRTDPGTNRNAARLVAHATHRSAHRARSIQPLPAL